MICYMISEKLVVKESLFLVLIKFISNKEQCLIKSYIKVLEINSKESSHIHDYLNKY